MTPRVEWSDEPPFNADFIFVLLQMKMEWMNLCL